MEGASVGASVSVGGSFKGVGVGVSGLVGQCKHTVFVRSIKSRRDGREQEQEWEQE